MDDIKSHADIIMQNGGNDSELSTDNSESESSKKQIPQIPHGGFPPIYHTVTSRVSKKILGKMQDLPSDDKISIVDIVSLDRKKRRPFIDLAKD